MRHESGSPREPGVLTPTLAMDIGDRTRRERILIALAASCATRTYSETTIANIVSEASISRGTFYKHFANKRECFDAAAHFFALELQNGIEEIYADGNSGIEPLRDAAAAVLAMLAAQPHFARLLLIEVPAVDPRLLHVHREALIGVLRTQWGSMRRTGPSPVIAFAKARMLLGSPIVATEPERLAELLPELVYYALLPFAGQATALEHAEQSR